MTDDAGLIEKLRSVRISRRGLAAGAAATLAARRGWEARAVRGCLAETGAGY